MVCADGRRLLLTPARSRAAGPSRRRLQSGVERHPRDDEPDTVLDVLGVCEEEAIVQPVHDDARGHAGQRTELHVRVATESVDPAKHGVMRPRAAPDDVDDREGDSDRERLAAADAPSRQLPPRFWQESVLLNADASEPPALLSALTADFASLARF